MVGRRKFLSDLLTSGVPAGLAIFGWVQSHPKKRADMLAQASSDPTTLNLKLGSIWTKIKGEGQSINGGTVFVSIRNMGTQSTAKVRVGLYQHPNSTENTLIGYQTVSIQPGEVRFPRFELSASMADDLAAQRIQLTASCFATALPSHGDLLAQSNQEE